MSKINNYKSLLKKVEEAIKHKNLDLSSGEDLSIGIMNLIATEEHLFFTYNKTKDEKYLIMLNNVRKLRTDLLKDIIKDYEGEVWCISKHLLAASMRIMEVGTKELKRGDKNKAASLFEKSYQLYSLFWGLNLSTNKKSNPESRMLNEEVHFIDEKGVEKDTESVFSKLGSLIQKALDCCRE
jgi:hypothetical protein